MRRELLTSWQRYSPTVRNLLGARRYAARALGIGEVPEGALVVHFAAVPSEVYQLEQWAAPLKAVEHRWPVRVIVNRPDVGRLVSSRTGLAVVFAPSATELERLVRDRPPAAVLYVNHREPNFRMLRHAHVPHVYLGHGESDKGASASHQNLAYDYAFVAGEAGRDRLAAALPFFDAQRRALLVGRPAVDHATPLPPVDPSLVLYAPTWEGALPSMALGSVASHGILLVSALLEGGFRVRYRPHPLTGSEQAAHREADLAIRNLLVRAGSAHGVDQGPYVAAFDGAALAVVDISSVAYDWLATGRPLLLTVPEQASAAPLASRLAEVAPRLPSSELSDAPALAERVRRLIRQPPQDLGGLVDYHFGDLTPGASQRRFEQALATVTEAWRTRA